MSPFSRQCQNLCLLSLAFIIDWRVVTIFVLDFQICSGIFSDDEMSMLSQSMSDMASSVGGGDQGGNTKEPEVGGAVLVFLPGALISLRSA